MKSLTTLVTAALLSLGACKRDVNLSTTMTGFEKSVKEEDNINDNTNDNNYENNETYYEDNETKEEGIYLKGPSILRAGQMGYFTLVNKVGQIDNVPELPESTQDQYYRGDWLVSDGSKVEFLDDKDNNQNTFQIMFNHPGEYRVWNKYEEYFIRVRVLEK